MNADDINTSCQAKHKDNKMYVANHSTGKTLSENEGEGETFTRVYVLWDFKGLHVLLRKRKCVLRKNDILQNHESKEKQDYFYVNSENGKFGNFDVNFMDVMKDTEIDWMRKTFSFNSTIQETIDQEHEKKSHTLTEANTLINQYLEIGTLYLDESNVFGVLRLAFELKLVDVYSAGLLFLSHSLSIGNCIKIWQLSKKFHSYNLTELAMTFIEQHITTSLLRKDQVSALTSLIYSPPDFESLEYLLQRFSSHKYKETAKAKGAITKLFSELMKQESLIWRYHFKEYLAQLEGTQQAQEDALQTLWKTQENSSNKRLEGRNTSVFMLSDLVASRGLGNKELDNPGNATAPKYQNEQVMGMIYDLKSSYRERRGILVAGGINDQTHEALDVAFMYEPEADTWTAMPSLTNARFNHTMVNLNGKVYVIGGKRQTAEKIHDGYVNEGRFLNNLRSAEQKHCSNSTTSCDNSHKPVAGRQKFIKITNDNHHISISPNNSFTLYQPNESCEDNSLMDNNQMSSVEVFPTESNKWCQTSSMILQRTEHSSVVVGDAIYVIGGHDGVAPLCSLEKYDSVKDQWTLENPMSGLCTGMSVVTDGQFLYVLGGYSGYEWLNTLACYDKKTKMWMNDNHPTMTTGRAFAGAELISEDIFVFGGVNSQGCLDECEVYNITSKTWRQGPHMNQPRCNAGHCVLQTKIFVFGGEAGGKLLDAVEYLDVESWEWKMVKKMPIRTAGLRCAQTNMHS